MSMTNSQRRKLAKRKDRERRVRRVANARRNIASPPKFRLDVELDGQWHEGVMVFRYPEQVRSYVETTENRRAAGEEIAPGRIVNLMVGRVIVRIPGSKSKGVLPDKITDGAKADPNVTAVPEDNPVEVKKEVSEETVTEK